MRVTNRPWAVGAAVAVVAAAALGWGISAGVQVNGAATPAVSSPSSATAPVVPSAGASGSVGAQRTSASQVPTDAAQVLRIGDPYVDARETTPTTSEGWRSGLVWRQVFRTLTRYRSGSPDLQPDLATSWSSVSGGRSWMFHLAAGRTFHDGTPLDAAAVCANVEAWAEDEYNAGWSYYLDGNDLQGCDAAGDTVTVRLEHPISNLPDLLSEVSFSIAAPSSFGGPPVGSGPYRYEGLQGQDTVRLVAVDPAAAGPDAIEIVQEDSSAAAVSALRDGDLDAVVGAAGDETKPDGKVRRIALPDMGMVSVQLFAGGSHLQDAQVRRGLIAALDPTALSGLMGADRGSGLAPSVLGLGSYPRPAHGVAAAKKLLQGKKIQPLVIGVGETGPWDLDHARLIQRQFAAAGVTASIQAAADQDEYYSAMRSGEYDVTVETLYADNLDPVEYVTYFDPEGPYRLLMPAGQRKGLETTLGSAYWSEDPKSRRDTSTALLQDLVAAAVTVPVSGLPEADWVAARVTSWPTGPFAIVDLSQVRLR